MKRIVVLIVVLLAAIMAMAYLYFADLNMEKRDNHGALYAAAADAAMVFSFQQDKSVMEILKSSSLLKDVIGPEKTRQLQSLQQHLLSLPIAAQATNRQNIYISILPGTEKTVEFLYCTQWMPGTEQSQLMDALRSSGSKITTRDSISELSLPDSSTFYLSFRNNLVMLAASKEILSRSLAHARTENNKFAEHIAATGRLQKNSLAELYIDFSRVPAFLKTFVAGNLGGELAIFEHQQAYATLVYNYSAEKILFTGSLQVNTKDSYTRLFLKEAPGSMDIVNLLPENTANYTAYRINRYGTWKKLLDQELRQEASSAKATALKRHIKDTYRIDPDQLFPKYFNGQLIRFQLSTGEKLGAINLSDGEKLEQFLLDLSSSYNEEIRIFKDGGLTEAYFGQAFMNFSRPYFAIKDNYMVFANNASTVQSFLNSYSANRLLINSPGYISAINQLPVTASVVSYIDLRNSSSILLRNIYLPYFRHLNSADGLKEYSSVTCQLNSDQDKFQVNLLLAKKTTVKTDTLLLQP